MAGEAITNKFMLGTATVMVGAQADLHRLGVAQSLGLMKNVSLKTTPAFTELSQGVKNSLVASVQTKNDMMVDGEMYEYTAKNLTYAVSLDGSAVVPAANSTTTTAGLTTSGSPATTPAVIPVTSATGIVAGGFLAIHVDSRDQIFIRKVVSVNALDVTVNAGLPVALASGSKVDVVNYTPLGSTKDNPYLSAKIVGQLADGSWVTVLLPKVRITSGVSLAFKTDNFDNIPLQLTVYDLTSADPNYAFFQEGDGNLMKAMLLTA